ncbi:hypothetical protein MBAV_001417 [Candidatus Magnetobacterium bavaricum]|uniref:Uncharacterized protein n=1 Tax=Candidatus Magnetobacterium bavaricum TaxID=29290 RepID=A0A0F3GX14_9BACT|nr:hypothetical protein MBAV_001417 [Candidatus Magnetobacterium bavaricum]
MLATDNIGKTSVSKRLASSGSTSQFRANSSFTAVTNQHANVVNANRILAFTLDDSIPPLWIGCAAAPVTCLDGCSFYGFAAIGVCYYAGEPARIVINWPEYLEIITCVFTIDAAIIVIYPGIVYAIFETLPI